MTISEIFDKADSLKYCTLAYCPYNCGAFQGYQIEDPGYDYKNFEEFMDASGRCLSCQGRSRIHVFWHHPTSFLNEIKSWFEEDKETKPERDVDEYLKKQQSDMFDNVFN